MKRTVTIKSMLILLALLAAVCPGQIVDHSGHDHATGGHATSDDSFAMGGETGAQATLTIHTVQGTEDGPAVGADNAIVELFHQGSRIRAIDIQLDDNGSTVVEGLSLAVPFVPRVTIIHENAYYQALGEPMDVNNVDQEITITVYEVTEEPLEWDISTQHVFVHPAPNGLHVEETLVVRNLTDRAWLGPADDLGHRSSLVIDVPDSATEIHLGPTLEFFGATPVEGRIVNPRPLVPGHYKLVFSYTIPVNDGQADIDITTAAPVQQLIVFIPTTNQHLGEAVQVTSESLSPGDVHDYHGQPVRAYRASQLEAGQRVSFALTGLSGGEQHANTSSLTTPQTVAILGGSLMVAALAAIMLIKPRKTKPKST